MAEYYGDSAISLGQLGKSNRTTRTIPHKFYESIYFEVPYLTRKSAGIKELLPSNDQVIYFENETPTEFAKLISEYLSNTQALSSRAEKAKAVYESKFSQKQIVKNFVSHAEKRFNLRIDLS